MIQTSSDLLSAKRRLVEARKICVLTGAGISAESGIPTFRGQGGLWRSRRAEELATEQAFMADPKVVWEWYDWRRGLIAQAAPNAGHQALARWEPSGRELTLVTQNVDGLHARAGSRNVLEVHGSIWRLRCLVCGTEREDFRVPLPDLPPRCVCGGIARPAVVWFGESLPSSVWDNAEKAAGSCEVLLVVGTSAVVYPAASLAPLARRSGACVMEVNLDETPLSASVQYCLRGASGVILPQLFS